MRILAGWTTAAGVLFTALAASAQGVDVNTDGRITVNSNGFISINTGSLTLSGGTVDLAANAGAGTYQFDVASDVIINSGTLTSAGFSGSIRLQGNWTNTSTGTWTPGNSTVTFSGGSNQSIDTDEALENFYDLTVNKSGNTLTANDKLDVANAFTLTAGTFDAEPAAAFLRHEFGSYTQNNGVLKVDVKSTVANVTDFAIDVLGDFTVAGGTYSTAATENLVSSAVLLQVRGNYSNSAAWPFTGCLRMYGSGAQSLTSAQGIRMIQAWSQAGANIISASGTIQTERLEVHQGIFRAPAGVTVQVTDLTDAIGHLTVATERIIRFTTYGAPLAATLRVDGGTIESPRLQNNLSAGGNNRTVNMTASGGTLRLTSSGAGCYGFSDLFYNVTHTLAGGTIEVAGDWFVSASNTFNATAGTVKFNGSGAQQINHPLVNGFYNLTIENSAADDATNFVTLDGPGVAVGNALTVTDGRLKLTSATATVTLTLNGAAHSIAAAGKLDLEPQNFGAVLNLAADAAVTVNGLFQAVRASDGATGTSTVQITGAPAAGWNMTLSSTATLDAQNFSFTHIGDTGIVIQNGATVVRWHEGNFSKEDSEASGPCIDLSAVAAVNRTKIPYTANDVTFGALPGGCRNVKSGIDSPIVTFLGTPANGWGESYDDDKGEDAALGANGRLLWEASIIVNVTTGTKYNSIMAAVQAAGASDRIRPLKGMWFDGNVNLQKGPAGGVILENFLFVPRTGYAVYNSDSALRGTLRNCAVASGSGLDYVTAQNCTVFDPSAGTAGITNSTITNCLYESGASLAGTTDTPAGSSATAASADFVADTQFEFHLVSTSSHINPGGTTNTPTGWSGVTPLQDMEEHTRPNGAKWDRGCDEYMSIGATRVNADLGYISRFQWMGVRRGPLTNTNGYAYAVSQSGSTSGYSNSFVIVNLDTMAVAGSIAAAGPIHYFTYWIDNTNADSNWRAWIFLVVDTNSDGYGDSIQAIVDYAGIYTGTGSVTARTGTISSSGTSVTGAGTNFQASDVGGWLTAGNQTRRITGYTSATSITIETAFSSNLPALTPYAVNHLKSPGGAVSSADPIDRRFGDQLISGSTYVYRPWATASNYRIRWIERANIHTDGSDDNGISYSGSAYRMEWLRIFFVAYHATGTTGGCLFKLNGDVYDTNDNGASNNRQFGRTIWAIVPQTDTDLTGAPHSLVDPTTLLVSTANNFQINAPLTFSWASGFQQLFVPLSDSSGNQNVLSRYNMSGTTVPSAGSTWAAVEKAGAVDNKWGVTLDNGMDGAGGTYSVDEIVYCRNLGSSGTGTDLRWASVLKDKAGSTTQPVMQPQRFWPNAFALVGYNGGVQKIWSQDGTFTHLTAGTTGGGGEFTLTVGSTTGFPSSGTLYVGDTLYTYSATTATTFTITSAAGIHHPGAPVLPPALAKNGCLASDGKKVKLGNATYSAPNWTEIIQPGDETSEIAGAKDTDWPIECTGAPMMKIWVRGTKIYWGTNKGFIYGWNWDSNGTGAAESLISGYPYMVPGGNITWIFVHPTGGVLVGTDTGGFYRFSP